MVRNVVRHLFFLLSGGAEYILYLHFFSFFILEAREYASYRKENTGQDRLCFLKEDDQDASRLEA
jgi:hypothetical protein